MRLPEWLFVSYFAYIVVLSGVFRDRPNLHAQPIAYLVASALFFLLLQKIERGTLQKPIAILRDWLPIVFLIIAFREMELFVPMKYDLILEHSWIKLDQLVLHDWGWRAAIESQEQYCPPTSSFAICSFMVSRLFRLAGLRRSKIGASWIIFGRFISLARSRLMLCFHIFLRYRRAMLFPM